MTDETSTEEPEEYPQHERLAKISDSGDFKDKISERFLPMYNYFYGPDDDLVVKTNRKLSAARIDDTAEMFISRALGYGVIAGVSLWLLVTISAFLFVWLTGFEVGSLIGIPIPNEDLATVVRAIRTPAVVLVSGIIFGSIGFLAGFYTPSIAAGMKGGSRERQIDVLLPDTVAYMYALSIGGMNQLEIMQAVADSEDVYGEVALEFQTVLNETEYFDVDYRTAIQHRAAETPSDKLAQFFTDMLSILSSGGDLTSFLDDKTDKHLRHAKEDQEDMIEMLEIFGEMYLNLSLLPLLLLILITIMQLMGGASEMMLMMVIYVVIPMIGIGFMVLMSTVLPDDPGDGKLEPRPGERQSSSSILDLSEVKANKGVSPVFDKFYSKELRDRAGTILKNPQMLFIERPFFTLILTVPVALFIVIGGFLSGIAPTGLEGIYAGLWGTFYYFYIPMYLILFPLTVFAVIHNRRKTAIVNNYTEALRKLSSANDTGQTLLESFMVVADTSTGRLSDELRAINSKVDYNYSIRQALTEFNNKYKSPELARINNLIIDAQETSSQIGEVLVTAAQTSENQDQLRRKRASRTRMQIAMILMTFFVLMAVIALLQDQFISMMGDLGGDLDTEGGGGGAMNFSAIEPTRTGILFFHAVTLQGVTGGMLCSYLASNSLKRSGLFIIPMTLIGLIVWMFLI
jgi:flagellar protein FlaJ